MQLAESVNGSLRDDGSRVPWFQRRIQLSNAAYF